MREYLRISYDELYLHVGSPAILVHRETELGNREDTAYTGTIGMKSYPDMGKILRVGGNSTHLMEIYNLGPGPHAAFVLVDALAPNLHLGISDSDEIFVYTDISE